MAQPFIDISGWSHLFPYLGNVQSVPSDGTSDDWTALSGCENKPCIVEEARSGTDSQFDGESVEKPLIIFPLFLPGVRKGMKVVVTRHNGVIDDYIVLVVQYLNFDTVTQLIVEQQL